MDPKGINNCHCDLLTILFLWHKILQIDSLAVLFLWQELKLFFAQQRTQIPLSSLLINPEDIVFLGSLQGASKQEFCQ